MDRLEDRQRVAQAWFEALQLRLIAAMEALEDECPLRTRPGAAPGRFVIEPWSRVDRSGAPGGGGRMAMLRGRLFEKMGVHVSTVFGTFAPEFAKQIPGAERGPALLGVRPLGDRPSLEPARADRAHEHALRRHHARRGSAAAPT